MPKSDVIRAEVMLLDIITELNLPISALDNFQGLLKLCLVTLTLLNNFSAVDQKELLLLKK